MEGRPCKGEGRNLSCFSGGLAFTVVIKNMAQILRKISNLNLRCLWHIQIEISKECYLVSISPDRESSLSFPKLCPSSTHFVRHVSTLPTVDMWDKSKTTVVPCYKIFLTLANNSLNKMRFWYIFSQLFLVICHPIENVKIQGGRYFHVIFFSPPSFIEI